MKVKVKFTQFDQYWVAEAENGAVSQGSDLEECRENIRDAIQELESHESKQHPMLSQKVEVLEVAI